MGAGAVVPSAAAEVPCAAVKLPDLAAKLGADLSEGERQRVAEVLRKAAEELDGGESQAENEGTDSLKEYFEKYYVQGGAFRNPDYAEGEDQWTWRHKPTGIEVWRDAIDLTHGGGGQALFHYTSEVAFRNITHPMKKAAEVWASLRTEGPHANAWWGPGIYTVPFPPDGWRDRLQLLDNNFRNMMAWLSLSLEISYIALCRFLLTWRVAKRKRRGNRCPVLLSLVPTVSYEGEVYTRCWWHLRNVWFLQPQLRRDLKEKGQTFVDAEYPPRAAFCVPIIVSPADAYDVSLRATPEMEAAGKEPGRNLADKLLNEPGMPTRTCRFPYRKSCTLVR